MIPIRWGFLGTGRITHDLAAALMKMPATEHQVCAVASRSLDRAIAFKEKLGISILKTYGSYEEIAKDPNLDVIYIGTVTPTHYPLAMMMMEAGHNVLIEKPMSINARFVKQLIEKAKEKRVFLLERFWCRFFPAYHHLCNGITSGSIGDIHSVMVNFGVDLSSLPVTRSFGREYADGALITLGCYAVQVATTMFNNERPEKITASAGFGEGGFDVDGTAVLQYGKGRQAVLNYAMDKFYDQTVTIVGTKGIIKLPSPWAPTEMTSSTKTHQCLPHNSAVKMNLINCKGFTDEIAAVRNCLLKVEKQHLLMSNEHSLIVMDIMDKIRSQIGMVYEEDKI